MSRRKQANPAKLGELESKDTMEDDRSTTSKSEDEDEEESGDVVLVAENAAQANCRPTNDYNGQANANGGNLQPVNPSNPHNSNGGNLQPVNPLNPHNSNGVIIHAVNTLNPHHSNGGNPQPVNPLNPHNSNGAIIHAVNTLNPHNSNGGNPQPVNPLNPHNSNGAIIHAVNTLNPHNSNGGNPQPVNPLNPHNANGAIIHAGNTLHPHHSNGGNLQPVNPLNPHNANGAIIHAGNTLHPHHSNGGNLQPVNPLNPHNANGAIIHAGNTLHPHHSHGATIHAGNTLHPHHSHGAILHAGNTLHPHHSHAAMLQAVNPLNPLNLNGGNLQVMNPFNPNYYKPCNARASYYMGLYPSNLCMMPRDPHESMLTSLPGSSPSSVEQSSPSSSCVSSSAGEQNDGDEQLTPGSSSAPTFECPHCKIVCGNTNELMKHITVHVNLPRYTCPYCTRYFKHKRSRDRHLKLHTGDKNYKCNHCDAAFARSDHLKIHVKTHENKKPYQCDTCSRSYNTAIALATHQQHHAAKEQDHGSGSGSGSGPAVAAAHGTPSESRCLQCSEVFPTSTELQCHIIDVHARLERDDDQRKSVKKMIVLPKIACIYCSRPCSSLSHMYEHINAEHANRIATVPRNYQINMAGVPQNYEDTMRILIDPPTYACERCNLHFASSNLLKDHVDTVHWAGRMNNANVPQMQGNVSRKRRADGSIETVQDPAPPVPELQSFSESVYEASTRPCICPYCNQQLANFNLFLMHMENHVNLNAGTSSATATTNNYSRICPICGEAGSNTVEFSKHIFLHTIAAVVGKCCHHCNKSFDNDDQYHKHLIDVHSQAYYKCTVCNDTFDNLINLNVHFQTKHTSACNHMKCNICPDQVFHAINAAQAHVALNHNTHLQASSLSRVQPVAMNDMNYTNVYPEHDPRYLYASPIQCSYCSRTFPDDNSHYLHLVNEHGDVRMPDNYLLTMSSSTATATATANQTLIPSNSSGYLASSGASLASPNNKNKVNAKSNYYKCNICKRSDMKTEGELIAHKKLHQSKTKEDPVSLQCGYCRIHCKSGGELETHIKTRHARYKNSKHKCNICDATFAESTILCEHKLMHCKIIQGNNCLICKTVLVDEQFFYNHQLQHGNQASVVGKLNSRQSPLPANCIVCSQTIQTDTEIALHAKFHLSYLRQKDVICANCNIVFFNSDSTTMKLDLRISGKDYTVSICNDCASGLKNLSLETVQANKARLIAIDKTNDDAPSSNLQSSSENSLLCNICKSMMASADDLQIHLIEHSFAGQQLHCYACGAVFTNAKGLRSHCVIHDYKSRPYECKDCKIRFSFKAELENHNYCHRWAPPQLETNGDANSRKNCFRLCPYCAKPYHESVYTEHVDYCAIKPDNPIAPNCDQLDQSDTTENDRRDSSSKKQNDKQ